MSRAFVNSEDLGLWIEARVDGCDTYAEVTTAVLRFVAVQQAIYLTNTHSLSEITNMLFYGQQAIDIDYVSEWLDIQYKDLDNEDTDLINTELEQNLTTHFGCRIIK